MRGVGPKKIFFAEIGLITKEYYEVAVKEQRVDGS